MRRRERSIDVEAGITNYFAEEAFGSDYLIWNYTNAVVIITYSFTIPL